METIKIYGTSWCPDCARAKQMFNKLKITFDWIDIDKDKQAARRSEKNQRRFQERTHHRLSG